MAEVKAFQAYLYNKKLSDQMGELISPPYDVLSENDRERLINKNSYNSVKLCLKSPDQTYSDMRKIFESWKSEEIVQKVEQDSLYLIEENYSSNQKSHRRVGFVGLLKVVPFEEKIVFPHEHTLSGPKADRLELLKSLRAEFSQIFFCYQDPELTLEKIYEKYSSEKPRIQSTDVHGVERKLWIVSDKSDLAKIQSMISSKELLIADGHHRYETALAMSQQEPGPQTEYVQAYFTNRDADGFEILPIHRLFNLPSSIDLDEFLNQLAQTFQIEKIDSTKTPTTLLQQSYSKEWIQFCMYLQSGAGFYLRRKKANQNDAEIFSLQRDIFENIFGWNSQEIAKGHLSFAHSEEGFFETLKTLPKGVGFFLPPTDLDLIMRVVKKSERMPQKSTFFYPKIASGLVIYELGSYT